MSDGLEAAEGAPVTVVYCGGCNPHIDRAGVAARLPLDGAGLHEGVRVHLSGCPRSCAAGHVLVHQDPAAVVVAGELVDGVRTPAPGLAAAVISKLKE